MNLKFNNLKDVKPKHGQEIWYIKESYFYGSYEFDLAMVEYQWDNDYGSGILYDPEDPAQPESDIDEETGQEIPYFLILMMGDICVRLDDSQKRVWWIDCVEMEKEMDNG